MWRAKRSGRLWPVGGSGEARPAEHRRADHRRNDDCGLTPPAHHASWYLHDAPFSPHDTGASVCRPWPPILTWPNRARKRPAARSEPLQPVSVGTPSSLWSGPPPGTRRPAGRESPSGRPLSSALIASEAPAGRRAPGRGDNPRVDLGDARGRPAWSDTGGQTTAKALGRSGRRRSGRRRAARKARAAVRRPAAGASAPGLQRAPGRSARVAPAAGAASRAACGWPRSAGGRRSADSAGHRRRRIVSHTEPPTREMPGAPGAARSLGGRHRMDVVARERTATGPSRCRCVPRGVPRTATGRWWAGEHSGGQQALLEAREPR